MALALDASAPAAVTAFATSQTTVTHTTASFTPPAGSVLLIELCTVEIFGGVHHIGAYAVTDNLATHLVYTQIGATLGNSGGDSQVTMWWAPVTTSQAMTVSGTYTYDNADTAMSLFRVLVITGASILAPIGATGGGHARATNLSGAAAQYVSTVDNSWGWVAYADWDSQGGPTVPAGETIDSSFSNSTASHAVIKNNATTPTAGTTVTLTTSTPTTGLNLAWRYFEVLPAVGPTVNSVPSGTPITAGNLSAKFLFFDTGDFGSGV